MQTGFDIMEYDSSLRKLWAKRLASDFIDYMITLLLSCLIGPYLPFLHLNFILTVFALQGVIWFIYSVIFDALWGKTPGKFALRIKAVSFIGDLNVLQSIARNLTKLNIIIFLGDIIAGLSTEGDPRQRLSERLVDSLVIAEIKEERKIKAFKIEEKEELELP